jgi:hypothetical protein
LTGLTKLWYIILMFLYYTSKRLSSDCWWVFEGRIGCGALPAPSLRSLRSLRSGTGHAFCRWVVALFRGVSGLIVSPLIDIMRSHRTCNACAMPGKKNPVMSHAIVVHPIDAELCQLRAGFLIIRCRGPGTALAGPAVVAVQLRITPLWPSRARRPEQKQSNAAITEKTRPRGIVLEKTSRTNPGA